MLQMKIGKRPYVKIRWPENWDHSLVRYLVASRLFQEWVLDFPNEHACWGIDFEVVEFTSEKIRYSFKADLRDSFGNNISRTVELTKNAE